MLTRPFTFRADHYVADTVNHTIRKGTPVTATLTISRQISNIVHHFTPPDPPFPGYVTDEIIFDRAGLTNVNLSQYSTFELRPFASGGQRIVVNAPTNFTSSVSLYYLAASDAASNPTTNNTLIFEGFSGVLPARYYSFFAIADAGNAVVFQADHSYANGVGFTAIKYAFTPTYNPTNSPKTFQLPTGGATNFLTFSYTTSQTNDPGPFVTLNASSPLSDVTYDPSLGTLPENQGFTRVDNNMAPSPTVSGGVLNQNTAGNIAARQWWYATSSDPFDFSSGFTLEANLYVISSSYNPDIGGGLRRAGYEFGAVDNTGRYLSINVTSNGLWLDTSGTNSAPPLQEARFSRRSTPPVDSIIIVWWRRAAMQLCLSMARRSCPHRWVPWWIRWTLIQLSSARIRCLPAARRNWHGSVLNPPRRWSFPSARKARPS